MNLQKYLIFLFFLILPTLTLAAGKHALLIGITDYSADSLKGAINDIELMQKVLQQRFDFQTKDFIILKNEKATRTGIKNAFAQLATRVKSGDFVYIHYSGHGSQTRDCNGDEQNGKDQTWVTYSSRTRKLWNTGHEDNYDVLDDEIDSWLQPIYAKTEQIVFVSDSCHSATVSRGGIPVSRVIKEDKRTHPLCTQSINSKLFIHRGIRIGAAQDHETTIEVPIEGNKFYGLFTWHWAHALQMANKDNTWHDIFKQTSARITTWRDGIQHPKIKKLLPQAQIEGRQDHLVLSSGFKPLPKTVTVEGIIPIKGVRIKAGKTVGVTKDSIYRLYKPQHPNPQELPYLTISDIDEFVSFGKPVGTFKTGDLVIEETHAYPFEPIPIFLQTDSTLKNNDELLLKEISIALNDKKQFPAYRLTNNPNQAQYFLHWLQVQQTPELQVLTPDGQLLHDNLQISLSNPTQAIEKLQTNLSKLARIRELKALQPHPPNDFSGKLQTFIFKPSLPCQKCDKCFLFNGITYCLKTNNELKNFQGKEFYIQDMLVFSITNESSDKDLYFYLFSISPDGSVEILFPSQYEVQKTDPTSMLKKGQQRFLLYY
ncbi:peptidase family C14 [Beggiatoa sp. PS]|nr:peptidase family C14 [Beggiatoa sp. PS]